MAVVTGSVGIPWRGAAAGVRWERIDGIDIPAAWASWPLGSQWALQGEYETRWRTVGLGLKGTRGAFMLRTSSASIGKSHSLGFNATLAWPF